MHQVLYSSQKSKRIRTQVRNLQANHQRLKHTCCLLLLTVTRKIVRVTHLLRLIRILHAAVITITTRLLITPVTLLRLLIHVIVLRLLLLLWLLLHNWHIARYRWLTTTKARWSEVHSAAVRIWPVI